jgi:putative transposase
MIEKEHETLSIRGQCQLLSLNRSRLYYKSNCLSDDTLLANEIHSLWLEMPFYGYRRITAELNRQGFLINGKRVIRLMREMNIQALYPRPRTSIRNEAHKIYPYLLKDLSIEYSDQAWATDITYIKLPGGFVYLVALIDWHSRYIISWRLSNTMDTHFCLEMLREALSRRKPEILNTDQGSQFTSEDWVKCVQEAGIKVSMDGKGRWVDNVIIERFWRTLKHEHILVHSFDSIAQLRQSIRDYITVYNHRRLHQSLGYKTPAEVYGIEASTNRPIRRPDGYVDNLQCKFTTYPQAQQQQQQAFLNLG